MPVVPLSFLKDERDPARGRHREAHYRASLETDRADLGQGSRALGSVERGSMPPAQTFGNWLVARLMRGLYNLPLTDLGPCRAVRRDLLAGLDRWEVKFSRLRHPRHRVSQRGLVVGGSP